MGRRRKQVVVVVPPGHKLICDKLHCQVKCVKCKQWTWTQVPESKEHKKWFREGYTCNTCISEGHDPMARMLTACQGDRCRRTEHYTES